MRKADQRTEGPMAAASAATVRLPWFETVVFPLFDSAAFFQSVRLSELLRQWKSCIQFQKVDARTTDQEAFIATVACRKGELARAAADRKTSLPSYKQFKQNQRGENAMPEFPNTRLLAVTILMVLVMAGCAPAPKASDSGYYAVNPDGEIYTDGKGNCWHITTREKTESDLRAECGDEISQPAMEEDSDGDGVPDSRDRCPNTPRGTQVDADGCPIEKQAPIVLKGVTFKFDSAELTAQAENRLDNVVNALQASTDLDFSIDGYTDSIGTEAYNQDLSQRRVDSVQEYLTSNGIDSGRITSTRGHGESDPVATNETTAGRAQNRRVELHVTGQ